tara:strand:- start:29925 stop:30536 length:612 start_codon:yes stop_codon:yes gene_type:complete
MKNSRDLEKKYGTDDVRIVSEAIHITADDNCVISNAKLLSFKEVPSGAPDKRVISCRIEVSEALFKPNGFAKACRSSAFRVHPFVEFPSRCLSEAVKIGLEDPERKATWQVIESSKEERVPEIKTKSKFTDEELDAISRQMVCVWSSDENSLKDRVRILLHIGAALGLSEGKKFGLFHNEKFVFGTDDLGEMRERMIEEGWSE